ncbi:long-chain acyl-CoA synthetase [hydrothermal vent metagenome]|uniref:Long-chain acyl-CoA synthetase n=1 Tax=hydrothermal vent metagenome TaxID=652676 RepID=A0A3B0QQP6_9ZZZZ
MTFYERLARETKAEREILYSSPLIVAALKGDVTLENYLDFLREAYHHVKHTVPLLNACSAGVPEDKAFVREALAEYVEEEQGHEEWILDDIENSGGDREQAKGAGPAPATEVMVAYAYDYIERVNPLGFFGMVFVLEGTSSQLATGAAGVIMQSLGLKEDSFHYLLSHGSLDQDHIKFFQKVVERITDQKDQDDIIHMARIIFRLYAGVFNSVIGK